MMQYLSLFVVLLSAVVAVMGETWNGKNTGIKRVTLTGWCVAALAVVGFAVSAALTRAAQDQSIKTEADLTAAKAAATRAADETASLKAQLTGYQALIEQVKQYAERQEQLVMIQAVDLGPGATWRSPNKINPGAKVEVFFFQGDRLVLDYGGKSQQIQKGPDSFGRLFVMGKSGAELSWRLTNPSSAAFEGKIAVYSTPRSRSEDWSWIEEQIVSITK